MLAIGLLLTGAADAVGQPAITSQPQNQTNYVGTTATFMAGASGTGPVSYQWQRYSTGFSDLPNQTNAQLALANVQTNDAADYRVVVTDATGTNNSAAAHLYVMLPPILSISLSNPGLATLSWHGDMVLLMSFSIDCPVWVRVGGVSPATLPISGSQVFFKLVALPPPDELQADFDNNLTIARDAYLDVDTRILSSEACVADYLLQAPVVPAQGYVGPLLGPNGLAQKALSIGFDLSNGDCVVRGETSWLQYINFRSHGP